MPYHFYLLDGNLSLLSLSFQPITIHIHSCLLRAVVIRDWPRALVLGPWIAIQRLISSVVRITLVTNIWLLPNYNEPAHGD